jgi:hypothetical protein
MYIGTLASEPTGRAGHALGVLSGDPPTRRDDTARRLADDDDPDVVAVDDGDRGRAAGGEIFGRAFSIRCF